MPARTPETFSLVGLEAMAYKTPVIASDVGGIGQWLKNNENGIIFPSGNFDKLAEAIDTLLSDDKLREKMGKQGQKMFNEHFKPSIHIDNLLKYFHELLPGEKR